MTALHKAIVEAILSQRPRGVMTYSGDAAPEGSDVAIAGWGLVDVTSLALTIEASLAKQQPEVSQRAPMGPTYLGVDIIGLEDRVGDLEEWRAATLARFNQTTADLGSILRRLDELERRDELVRARVGVIAYNLRAETPPGFKKPWQDDFELLVKSIHDLRADIVAAMRPTPVHCRRCNGSGRVQCLPSQNKGDSMRTCDACNGQGTVRT